MLLLNHLFSDAAVLQRGKTIRIWGCGDEGKMVSVAIQNVSAAAPVKDGKWSISLPPLAASESEDLSVSDGVETIRIKNVAVGEVWIAGGQSNMEFPLRALREFRRIRNTCVPAVRLFGVPRISYAGQLDDDDFSEYRIWRPCTPEHLWFYSAIPFYFALQLHEHEQVPVGIVDCNFGGTIAAAWAERSILERTRAKIWIEEFERKIQGLDLEKYTREFKANPMFKTESQNHSAAQDKMWRGFSDFEMFFRKPFFKRRFRHLPVIGPLDRNRPCTLFENMVSPIAPFGARGVIWYQGESDDPHADVYDDAMGAVIDSWRECWQDEFPFLMVQLAPYEGFLGMPVMNYVQLREQQEKVARTKPKVYITNAMDCGMRHDVHPKQKKPVAMRLALLARGKIYGEEILCEAPEAISCRHVDNRVEVDFDHCGAGLRQERKDRGALEVMVAGKLVDGWILRVGKSRLMIESDAFRGAADIVVSYGRKNYCECNIKNSAGIPVMPFVRKASKV